MISEIIIAIGAKGPTWCWKSLKFSYFFFSNFYIILYQASNQTQTSRKKDNELYLQNEYYLNKISYSTHLFLVYSHWSKKKMVIIGNCWWYLKWYHNFFQQKYDQLPLQTEYNKRKLVLFSINLLFSSATMLCSIEILLGYIFKSFKQLIWSLLIISVFDNGTNESTNQQLMKCFKIIPT